MQANEVTAFGLVVVLALAGIYDSWAGLTMGYSATITSVVRDYSARWTLIPFGLGALVAHLMGW